MEKTKTQNKKFFIALISLSVALLCVLGAIIGIWAATQQTVSSSFSVQYNVGNNIAFKVTAYRLYPGETVATSIGTMQYNVDGTKTGNIETQNIAFTAERSDVKLYYQFENIGDNAVYFTMSWSDLDEYVLGEMAKTDDINNVGIAFGNLNTLSIEKDALYSDIFADGTVNFPYSGFKMTIAPGAIYNMSIAIGVANLNKSAYCNSSGENGLNFILTDTDVADA